MLRTTNDTNLIKQCMYIILLGIFTVYYVPITIAETDSQPASQPNVDGTESENVIFLPLVMYDILTFTVNARIYQEVDDLLIAGDHVGISATRNETNTPVDQSETGEPSKFDQALTVMSVIDEEVTGVTKGISFSAIDDISALLSQLPEDIEWVSYNTETGLTPEAELENLTFYVQIFANLVHQSGRKASWAPTLDDLSMMELDGRIGEVLPHLDAIGVQHQRLLMLCGLHGEIGNPQCMRDGQPFGFVEETQRRVNLYHSLSPNLLVRVQLWYGTNTPKEAATAFSLAQGSMDSAVFYANTSAGDSAEATRQVLIGLGR